MSPDKEPWKPRYRDGKHNFTVPGVKLAECPTGYVSRRSEEFLHEFYRRKRLKEVGLTSDTSRLPVRVLDAMDTLEIEECRYEECRRKSGDDER